MEHMKKTAVWIDRIRAVFFWICMACAALLTAVLAAALILGPGSMPYDVFLSQLELGPLSLMLKPAYMPDPASTTPMLALFLATMLVAGGALIPCNRLMRRVLAAMRQGQPFAGSVSRDLRKLAWLYLGSNLVLTALTAAAERMTLSAYGLIGLLNMDRIDQVSHTTVIDLNFVLTGLVILLLALVFRYGEELQQLSDETL